LKVSSLSEERFFDFLRFYRLGAVIRAIAGGELASPPPLQGMMRVGLITIPGVLSGQLLARVNPLDAVSTSGVDSVSVSIY
jgi:Uncharacterised protein family (UPF0014)